MIVVGQFPAAVAVPAPSVPWPSVPWPRWAALVGLLLVEAIVLSLCFDADAAANGTEWWTRLFRHALLPRAGLTAFAALLVFGGARVRSEISAEPAAFAALPPRFGLVLVGHLLLLAAFAGAASLVLSPAIHSQSLPEGWIAGWLILGLASVASWAALLLPLPLWRRLAAGNVSLAVGAVLLGVLSAASYRFNRSWHLLSQSTLWIVQRSLQLFFPHTVCDPIQRIVGTPEFAVQIDKQCAGYEGVALVCLFLAAYLWFFRSSLRFPQALLLLPLGVVLSWLGNIVRIVALIALGSRVSADIALDGFHSQAGWLLFNGVALGSVAVTQRSRFFSTAVMLDASRGAASTEQRERPAAPYLLPFLVVLATAMVSRAFSAGFDSLYPLRVLAGLGCLWYFRDTYIRWLWHWDWPAAGIGAGVFVIWLALDALLPQAPSSTITAALAAMSRPFASLWIAFRIVGAVVVVPLTEELAFRGYLTRRLISADFDAVSRRRFTWLSFVVSSALFGALHGRWIAGTIAGAAFALAVYRRGRITDAILAHAACNALIAAYVLGTGSYGLW